MYVLLHYNCMLKLKLLQVDKNDNTKNTSRVRSSALLTKILLLKIKSILYVT